MQAEGPVLEGPDVVTHDRVAVLRNFQGQVFCFAETGRGAEFGGLSGGVWVGCRPLGSSS